MTTKKTDTNEKVPQKPKLEGRDANGRFIKGSKKPENSGRKPGVKNTYTNLRDTVKEQCGPLLDNLGAMLMEIDDPKDRLDALSKFVPFFLPKYSSTTISADTDRPLSEEEHLVELDNAYTKKQVEIKIKAIKVVDNDNGGVSADIPNKDLGL